MFRIAAFSTTALTLSMTAAIAAPAIGRVGDKTIVMFDTETLEVSGTMDVTGVDSLLGFDLRPADNTLVGVTPDMVIVTIDTATGEATELSTMDTALPVADQPVIVDFNPMADRLRFMTGTTNHRVDVDTGAVTVDGSLDWQDGDMHAGETPMIAAAAYINSFGTPESTAMYNIDSTIGGLIQQVAPNDGTLAAIGTLGLDAASSNYAFDVQSTDGIDNMAWLVNGTTLYSVDLETGAATMTGEIAGVDGMIRDIAILPAM